MNRRLLGRAGEWVALVWLILHGYRLRDHNWRGAGGELDLVMEQSGEIVFVEVKTRTGDDFGGPEGAVNKKKRENLIRTASTYLGRYTLWEQPCRFDVVALRRRGRLPIFSVRHMKNAFRPDLGRRM
ncbi:MAG: YraN family protein [Thermoanaerobaculales bacterium]|nr:YraN family protein [Thermoanaerobaculales bacterium]